MKAKFLPLIIIQGLVAKVNMCIYYNRIWQLLK